MIFCIGLRKGAHMGKDVEWKSFFQDNHRYADIINGIGCSGVQFVKDTDLQEVDTSSKKKSRDILRRVAFGMNFAIVGIENQEELDYELPLRNMHYDITQYQKQASAIRKEVRSDSKGLSPGEYMYGFKKDSKLNPLITIVLYAGKDAWDGPTCLHDMLDFTDVPEGLKEFTANYKINLIDIRQFENTDVFKTDVKQVFDFIKYSDDKQKILELVEGDEYYQQMDDDAFDVVAKYTNSKELVKAKQYQIEGGKKDVCKAIRDLMDDSWEKGREEGRENALMETAKNLLDILSDEEIAKRVSLPLEQVRELRRERL